MILRNEDGQLRATYTWKAAGETGDESGVQRSSVAVVEGIVSSNSSGNGTGSFASVAFLRVYISQSGNSGGSGGLVPALVLALHINYISRTMNSLRFSFQWHSLRL